MADEQRLYINYKSHKKIHTLSEYNIVIDSFPLSDMALVCNLLSQKSVAIPRSLWARIQTSTCLDNFTDSEVQFLNRLFRIGALVDSVEEERRKCLSYMNLPDEKDESLFLTIITTKNCNCACEYCMIQEGLGVGSIMDISTASVVSSWIIERVRQTRRQLLDVRFFGGEPLLNTDALEIMLSEIGTYCRQTGIEFTPSISTNGTLLDMGVVKKLGRHGPLRYCIPFAGIGEEHDRRRPFDRKQGGTFEATMNGLRAAAKFHTVAINCNFDENNWESFPLLLDIIMKEGLRENIVVVFSPILQSVYNKPYSASRSLEEMDFDLYIKLITDALARGFRVNTDYGIFPCPMDRTHSYVITPNGEIHKCSILASGGEPGIGKLSDVNSCFPAFGHTPRKIDNQCIGCPWLPVCGGGCACQNLNFKEPDEFKEACLIKYFEHVGRFCIRLKYLEELLSP